MTVILTNEQYREQLEADKQKGVARENFFSNECEQVRYCHNAYVNNECDRYINLRHGLKLRIWSFEPLQDVIFANIGSVSDRLSLSLFATGEMHTHLHGITEKIYEAAGNSYLQYCPGAKETEGWKANQKILRVKIIIEPAKFFQGISLEQFDSLPQQLKQFATKDTVAPFYLQNAIAPKIMPIVTDILTCPYQGGIKQLYLEAKAFELMALQFSQLSESANNSTVKRQISHLDSIHQAKDILLQNYLNPPSVIELARLVGVSRVKLQQGFREVFNTTPFDYLQNYRLDLARILLQDEKLTVATVAHRIGYSDASYFSRAFQHRFGITPGQCRSGHKISKNIKEI